VKLRSVLLLCAAVMTMLSVAQASASASPAGTANAASSLFSQQASHAGLTVMQAATLQNTVKTYLEKEGGTQVAANEIRLSDGGTLLVALPGEKRARYLNQTPDAGAPCPINYICAYQFENYEGSLLTETDCGFANRRDIPWGGDGSWQYNKIGSNRGSFWNDAGVVAGTGPGPSAGTPIYWGNILYMIAC